MRDDPDDVGRLRESAEQFREEAARSRAERVAGQRVLLRLVPGDLRDLDAAAECECSCHPRPGVPSTDAGELCRLASIRRLLQTIRPQGRQRRSGFAQ